MDTSVGIKIDDVTIKKLQTPDLKINTKEKTIPKNENPIKSLEIQLHWVMLYRCMDA